MTRRNCQDHTEAAAKLKEADEAKRKERRETFWGVIGLITFFILYCIVGTLEYNSLYGG